MDNFRSPSPFIAIAVAFISFVVYRLITTSRALAPFPPGPKPLPIIGNLLDLPQTHPHRTFSRWADMYGGITYVRALGQSMVVLNDPKYATDMLDKKGLLYSDRPKLVMGRLIGWDQSPALISFGDRWVEYRRLLNNFMGTKAKVDAFNDAFQEETNVYLKEILDKPRDWVEHTSRLSGGIVLRLVYGCRASDPGGEELVKLVDEAMVGFSATVKANAFLVDIIPVLRHVPAWFPGAVWKRKAKVYHDYLERLLHDPFELVKQQMAGGVARASFTQSHLEDKTLAPEKERIIQWAAAGIYSGGADTTVAGIEAFVLGITCRPEEQKLAQAEIDAVIGRDRLPTLADREQLPYCEGLYLEIIRTYNTTPLGLAHVAREDDVYNGYHIPKGSIVITNNWYFYRNPETYPNPEIFSPERFIGSEKQFDPRKYLFGFGRRICPGIHFADASIWLACVSILAAFDVAPPIKNGKPVIPSGDFQDGGIRHPEPFKCIIKPRSASTEALVHGLSGNL